MGENHTSVRRGLTLVESVIATAVLAVAITGIFSALAAGTAHAGASADDLAASVAAEDLLDRVLHDCDHRGIDPLEWDGHEEMPGELVDAEGRPIFGGAARVGRRIRVEESIRGIGDGPSIDGRLLQVIAVDRRGRRLGSVERWIPHTLGDPR
jgi:type II secretory pathway pseudopilin PulG